LISRKGNQLITGRALTGGLLVAKNLILGQALEIDRATSTGARHEQAR